MVGHPFHEYRHSRCPWARHFDANVDSYLRKPSGHIYKSCIASLCVQSHCSGGGALSSELLIDHSELLHLLVVSISSSTNASSNAASRICHLNLTNGTTLNFQDEVKKETVYLVMVGCLVVVSGYFQVTFWNLSGKRQTNVIQKRLFHSILHKDMVYFDTNKTGELNTKLTQDIVKIHDGIGDKAGSVVQLTSSFLTGIILGEFNFADDSVQHRF